MPLPFFSAATPFAAASLGFSLAVMGLIVGGGLMQEFFDATDKDMRPETELVNKQTRDI